MLLFFKAACKHTDASTNLAEVLKNGKAGKGIRLLDHSRLGSHFVVLKPA